MLLRLLLGNSSPIAVTFSLPLLTNPITLVELNLTVSVLTQRPQYLNKHRMSASALLRITSMNICTTAADIALFTKWFPMKAKSATFMTREGMLNSAGHLSQGNACSTVILLRKKTSILLFWLSLLLAKVPLRRKTCKAVSREKSIPMCPHVTGQLKTGIPTAIVWLILPLMASLSGSLDFSLDSLFS